MIQAAAIQVLGFRDSGTARAPCRQPIRTLNGPQQMRVPARGSGRALGLMLQGVRKVSCAPLPLASSEAIPRRPATTASAAVAGAAGAPPAASSRLADAYSSRLRSHKILGMHGFDVLGFRASTRFFAALAFDSNRSL